MDSFLVGIGSQFDESTSEENVGLRLMDSMEESRSRIELGFSKTSESRVDEPVFDHCKFRDVFYQKLEANYVNRPPGGTKISSIDTERTSKG